MSKKEGKTIRVSIDLPEALHVAAKAAAAVEWQSLNLFCIHAVREKTLDLAKIDTHAPEFLPMGLRTRKER